MDWKHCSKNISPEHSLSEAKCESKAWRRAGNVTKQNPEESNSLGPKHRRKKTPRMHGEQRVLGEQEIRKEGGRGGKDGHTE